jgi:DNA-binding IclR family transcriptional regulator
VATVQSVERAFSVLGALTSGPAGVSEIAERTGLPKSTVSRMLTTLVELGAVEQSEMLGVYGLGEVIIDLATAASPGRNLVTLARPYLEELAEQTGEAAGLSMLDGGKVYYLDQVDSEHEVQVRDWSGESIDAHVVPSGMVLLAYSDEDLVADVLDAPLVAMTARTLTDPAAVRARLALVREQGYAWGLEEMSDGLNSVAGPIVNPWGTVIAAVHVHGPSYRFPKPDQADEIASMVVRAGQRIGDRLAGRHRPT